MMHCVSVLYMTPRVVGGAGVQHVQANIAMSASIQACLVLLQPELKPVTCMSNRTALWRTFVTDSTQVTCVIHCRCW